MERGKWGEPVQPGGVGAGERPKWGDGAPLPQFSLEETASHMDGQFSNKNILNVLFVCLCVRNPGY